MNQPVIRATLGNPEHPEYGVVTIPFPMPEAQYGAILEKLTAIGIGDAIQRDCFVTELDRSCTVLKCLEQQKINVDELDYLAKRLDTFGTEEVTRYSALAGYMGLHDMTDLINLTFCCLQTIYGVLHENGMVLEPVYDGRIFPYAHETCKPLTVSFRRPDASRAERALVQLPIPDAAVGRVMARSGAETGTPLVLEIEQGPLQKTIRSFLTGNVRTLTDGNKAAKALEILPKGKWNKLAAALRFAKPETIEQFVQLTDPDRLFDFEFLPDVCTAKDCGRYLIKQSGHYVYDEELDEFYDYEKLGHLWVKQHPGLFTPEGYISYEGEMPLEDVLAGSDRQQQNPPQPEMAMG